MTKRYRAFVSYAHHDERWAKWLQRSLERYRVPKKLRRVHADGQALPSRLNPIFRDRDELASSADLSESIRHAMDHSDALVIICSPAAAKSKWVNAEIRYFQSAGRSRQIFCLLVSGSPDRNRPDCAFPRALLEDRDGIALHEPLAADLSGGGDSRRDALLKIAAGLLGVGIDDLKQRDAQRKLRLSAAIAAGSLAVAVVTIGFAIAAQLAREEADIRRGQAEDLISFMLGDLRAKLEPVGRLDLLDAVGDEAMEYFAAFGDRGTDEEVLARAIALRQIGEVRFRQGRLVEAQGIFEESRGISETLFASAPENKEYLFELGQAEFWVGYATLEQSLLDQAIDSFTKYMAYSRQLLSAEPDNAAYQEELMYAYSNLGTVELEIANPAAALENFQQSLRINLDLVASFPDDLDLKHSLGTGYSWLGEAHLQLGQLEESVVAYGDAVAELLALHATETNRVFSEHFAQNSYHLGNVLLGQGKLAEAESRFQTALDVCNELVSFDSDNAIWRSDRGISARFLAEVLVLSGRVGRAYALLEQSIEDFGESVATDPEDLRNVENLALAESSLAMLTLDDSIEQALAISARAQSRISELTEMEIVKSRTVLNAGKVAEIHGRILSASGDTGAADSTWRHALDLLSASPDLGLEKLAIERQLLSHLKDDAAAARLEARLVSAGFKDPRFL